jgi:hypothetical protein
MTLPPAALSCDVFCRVVDNYGDAAVCWRLASGLAAGEGFRVRLWIDRPEVLAALQPALDPAVDAQWLDGVQVRRWPPPPDEPDLPDIAIDAFGGGLPDAYAAALAALKYAQGHGGRVAARMTLGITEGGSEAARRQFAGPMLVGDDERAVGPVDALQLAADMAQHDRRPCVGDDQLEGGVRDFAHATTPGTSKSTFTSEPS